MKMDELNEVGEREAMDMLKCFEEDEDIEDLYCHPLKPYKKIYCTGVNEERGD